MNCARNKINILETHIAVKSETTIQIASIAQNHFIIFIPKINKISATKSQVIFESQIAVQECLNQVFIASFIFFHCWNSYFILSNIRIFASIAIQIDIINQAIEARVKTIQSAFTINKTIIA